MLKVIRLRITSVPGELNGCVDSDVLVEGLHLFGSHFQHTSLQPIKFIQFTPSVNQETSIIH